MTRDIVITRPLTGAKHLILKGEPQIMEDGSVGLTCKDMDTGGKYYLSLSPDLVRSMFEFVNGSKLSPSHQPVTKADQP
jgi:hypothetical protein